MCTSFCVPLHYRDVSGVLQAPAGLLSGKQPSVRCMDCRAGLDVMKKRIILYSYPESYHDSSVVQSIACTVKYLVTKNISLYGHWHQGDKDRKEQNIVWYRYFISNYIESYVFIFQCSLPKAMIKVTSWDRIASNILSSAYLSSQWHVTRAARLTVPKPACGHHPLCQWGVWEIETGSLLRLVTECDSSLPSFIYAF
jgi:hypothetical protein